MVILYSSCLTDSVFRFYVDVYNLNLHTDVLKAQFLWDRAIVSSVEMINIFKLTEVLDQGFPPSRRAPNQDGQAPFTRNNRTQGASDTNVRNVSNLYIYHQIVSLQTPTLLTIVYR